MLSGIDMFAEGNWLGRIETPLYDYIFITKHRSISKTVYCLESLVICCYCA